jgi:hydrogenase nickel incorporation protein HypA/HybF
MHELSIAQEILRIVHQYVPDPQPNNIKSVKVSIGKMSNILTDSLTFCFEAITSDSALNGTKLEIIENPVKIICLNCSKESEIEPPVFACPVCGHNQIKIISGTEMRVEEIELFDELEPTSESDDQIKEKE